MTNDNTKVTVGSTSTLILKGKGSRKFAVLVNDSDETIYLALGEAAVLNEGIRLNAEGGAYEINANNPHDGAVYGICTSGSKNITVSERF